MVLPQTTLLVSSVWFQTKIEKSTGITVSNIRWFLWHSSIVPTSTDARIMQLFGQVIAAKDEAELKRVAKELRAAITEHARVARSLAGKASMIAARDACRR